MLLPTLLLAGRQHTSPAACFGRPLRQGRLVSGWFSWLPLWLTRFLLTDDGPPARIRDSAGFHRSGGRRSAGAQSHGASMRVSAVAHGAKRIWRCKRADRTSGSPRGMLSLSSACLACQSVPRRADYHFVACGAFPAHIHDPTDIGPGLSFIPFARIAGRVGALACGGDQQEQERSMKTSQGPTACCSNHA